MRIDAVVLNWKRADDTITCVRSLRASAPDVHVTVVDNASRDGSVERIRAAQLGATVIENLENLGYAGGNNVGMRAALERGADAVLVLNNDLVVQEQCVEGLVAALSAHENWGIASPLSLKLDDPGCVDFYRAEIQPLYLAVRAIGRDSRQIPTEDAVTDYATGSALLMRSEVLREIGLFDERYFLLWEDVDLSLRVRRAGYVCGVTPAARVLHAGSVSFGGQSSPLYQYFYVRNSFLLVRAHPEIFEVPNRRFGVIPRPVGEALLRRRYRGWLRAANLSPQARAAIERGVEDAMHDRFGPAPVDLFS